jgi:lysophospholipase L1-like esterase
VILGTNEWNGVNNGTKLRIMQLHDRLEKLDVSSIWITPPVPNSDQFYEMVRDVYGDNAYDFRNIDLPRGPDNIHPTIKGYIVWSKAILLNLRNNGVL